MRRTLILTLPLLLALPSLAQEARDPWVLYRREAPSTPPKEEAPSGSPTLPGFPSDLPSGLPSPTPSFPLPPPGVSLTGKPPSEASPSTPSPLYPPGTLKAGKLLTGIYLIPGQSVPVALRLDDGTVLVGRAEFSGTGRVWITVNTAVKDGNSQPVQGVVLEAKEVTHGLPAQVGEEAPNLLADLTRGMLGGVSDYVKASLEATKVITLPGGGQQTERQVPGLELFLLARAADLVAVPQGQKAIIRTVKVDRGTRVIVLFLGEGASRTEPEPTGPAGPKAP